MTLADVLARALAAHRARVHRRDETWGRAGDIGDARPRNSGCLLKATLLILLLLALVLGAPFLLLSGFLQYFL